MKFIDNYKSPNFDKRKIGSSLKYIILHYTAMRNYKEALRHMCEEKNKVSHRAIALAALKEHIKNKKTKERPL